MTDDYQQKLRDFLAPIPEFPGQTVSGSATPAPYPAGLKEKLKDKNYSAQFVLATNPAYPTTPAFMQCTGTSHSTLVKNWVEGGIMTTCNALAGKCGVAMGAKHFLGQFELEDFLHKIGKAHAWIPASGGKRPGVGDIFRAASFHMGVSLGFEGNTWLTVEGGQGGKGIGYDIVKRKQQAFNPGHLQGWCNLRLYLDPRPAIPDWLVGQWVIYSGDKTFSYRFNEYYEAFFYRTAPAGNPENAIPTDTGTVGLQGTDAVTVTWKSEGGVETFKYDRFTSFPGIREEMSGLSNRREPLKGIRL